MKNAFIILGTLAAIPLLYVLSYLLILESAVAVPGFGGWFVEREPHYHFGGRVSETIFSPLQALDKRLRPAYWETPAFYEPTAAEQELIDTHLHR
jgi:hypothetical protein